MEVDDLKSNDSGKSSLFEGLQQGNKEGDESHLPPGVRRQNRCHSSSSENEQEEKATKRKSESGSSDSDSEDERSKKASTKTEVEDSKSPDGKATDSDKSKATQISAAVSKKGRENSRSKSKSHSPSRSHKRRRSSERGRGSRSRSRSQERKHKRDRRRRPQKSRSRDRRRSKDRDHHKRHRDNKRSRSRDRRDYHKDHNSSRDRDRKSSRERERKGSHQSRDRGGGQRGNKSRSSSPRGSKIIKFGDKVIKAGASFGRPISSKPMTFKEKMRQQFIKAIEEGADVSTALTSKDGTVLCTQTAGTLQNIAPTPKKPPVPLMANLVMSTAGLAAATITASEAAMHSLLQLQKETTAKTGVEIPSYYNPGAINPVKYAEQVQKRKLLWSKNKDKVCNDVNSQWHATTLSGEHDDKSKEKFRKLMGIKEDDTEPDKEQEQELKQRQLFDQLDKEYQYARMATHTHRGIGLGFGSSAYQPVVQPAVQPPQPPPTSTGT